MIPGKNLIDSVKFPAYYSIKKDVLNDVGHHVWDFVRHAAAWENPVVDFVYDRVVYGPR